MPLLLPLLVNFTPPNLAICPNFSPYLSLFYLDLVVISCVLHHFAFLV